jgi:uncharacterized membrane protein HdeD (DUF308 family)
MRFDVSALAKRWWVLVVRGLAAILFGCLAILTPGLSLLALVLMWGAYAVVDGVFHVMLAAQGARAGRRWGWLLFESIVSILAGVVTFAWPGITALMLVTVIACWAFLTGIAEIAAAVRLRHEIEGEWLLAASGVLSIVLGVLFLFFPAAGALAIAWVIGVYALLFGGLLVSLGVRIHRWDRLQHGPHAAGGMPTPA